MTDFDAKLTLLHKKFHSLELGLISDILRSCGDNVDQAGSMLASMIPTEPPVDVTSLERDESDEGEILKRNTDRNTYLCRAAKGARGIAAGS